MAQGQFALLGLLTELRTADGGELMRRLLGGASQLLVDAEATQVIGARPDERTAPGPRSRTPATALRATSGRPATLAGEVPSAG